MRICLIEIFLNYTKLTVLYEIDIKAKDSSKKSNCPQLASNPDLLQESETILTELTHHLLANLIILDPIIVSHALLILAELNQVQKSIGAPTTINLKILNQHLPS